MAARVRSSGLLKHELVAVGVADDSFGSPRLLLEQAVKRDPFGREPVALGREVLGREDESLQRAGRHGLKPCDERERRRAALRGHLDPANARDRVVVASELEAELLDVELLRSLLVGYGDRDHLHVFDGHVASCLIGWLRDDPSCWPDRKGPVGRSVMRPARVQRGVRELLLEIELRPRQMRHALRDALRRAIQDGRLPAETVLPSSRRLASDLRVSRGVVTDAYEQLAAEGYLAVPERLAPMVADIVTTAPAAPEPAPVSWRFDLGAVTPDVGLFPRREWRRAMEQALRTAPDAALDYADHRGRIELRTALSEYLARVRGARIDAGRVIITQGFTQALDLLCRVLVRNGATKLGVESPSHPGLWATVRSAGLELVGCPVDSDGLRPDLLGDLGADAVVVAPAHQFPTGVVMTPARCADRLGGDAREPDHRGRLRRGVPLRPRRRRRRPRSRSRSGSARRLGVEDARPRRTPRLDQRPTRARRPPQRTEVSRRLRIPRTRPTRARAPDAQRRLRAACVAGPPRLPTSTRPARTGDHGAAARARAHRRRCWHAAPPPATRSRPRPRARGDRVRSRREHLRALANAPELAAGPRAAARLRSPHRAEHRQSRRRARHRCRPKTRPAAPELGKAEHGRCEARDQHVRLPTSPLLTAQRKRHPSPRDAPSR